MLNLEFILRYFVNRAPGHYWIAPTSIMKGEETSSTRLDVDLMTILNVV